MILKPVQVLEPRAPAVSRRTLFSALAGVVGGAAIGLGSRSLLWADRDPEIDHGQRSWQDQALALADGPTRELVMQHEFFLVAAARLGDDQHAVRRGIERLARAIADPDLDVPVVVRDRAIRNLNAFQGTRDRFVERGGR